MAKYRSKKKIERNNKSFKKMLKKIAIIGAVGALAITPVASEVMEHQKVKEIEENAEKKVPRSFKKYKSRRHGKIFEGTNRNIISNLSRFG